MPYNDYPEAMTNNARRGRELNEEVGGKCATDVGKKTARILVNKETLSDDRVVRMFSFLSRAETYYDESDTKACGTISYLLWGGKAAKRWSEARVKEMQERELSGTAKTALERTRLKSTTKRWRPNPRKPTWVCWRRSITEALEPMRPTHKACGHR